MAADEDHASFERTLASCGVATDSLSLGARADLDLRGYHVFPDILDTAWLAELRELIATRTRAAQDRGTRHVDLLSAPHPAVDRLLTEARMLAAAQHLLARPFRWSSLSCRDPQPGFGAQGLHTDWPPRLPGEPAWVATLIWLLDDFTADNGATRVVPGSHTQPAGPGKDWRQPGRQHPEQVVITAPAGSVLVFSGHLWHSGTTNASHAPRRVLQVSCVAREQRSIPLLEHPAPSQLDAAGRVLLGLAD